MKNLKFSALLALILIGFGESLRAEFLYVTTICHGLLSFSIDPKTGALTQLPSSPLVTPAAIGNLTLDHTGKLLYASTGSSVYGFRIPSNGQLVPLPGSPYKVNGGGLAVDPFDRFLYAVTSPYQQPGTIAVYRIEPNGSLKAVPGSPFPTGSGPTSVATDPFGRFVYVTNNQSGNVSVYSVLSNGALEPVPGSPFSALISYNGGGTFPADVIRVVTEPTGRFVYVASENSSSLISYRVGPNGALTQLSGSPLTFISNWIDDMAINPLGGFLYAIVSTAGFDVFRINNITKLPELIQGIDVGNGQLDNSPVGICVSPNGKFVYEGNANVDPGPGPMTLRGFKVGSDGLLTPVPRSPYFPLGVGDYMKDPATFAVEGWPSSMVVAP
jgi:6-phosphogluconolactonase (cycloisomerase 2 family)